MSNAPKAFEINIVELADRVRPSVMLLMVYDTAGLESGTGMGVVVSSDGLFLTNRHLIHRGASAKAIDHEGKSHDVLGVVADDPDHDLVLLKIRGDGLAVSSLATSANLDECQPLAIISSQFDFKALFSVGTMVHLTNGFLSRERWIHINGAVSTLSRGSPVFHVNGTVVGVMTLVGRKEKPRSYALGAETAQALLTRAANAETQPLLEFTNQNRTEFYLDAHFLSALAADLEGDHPTALQSAHDVAKHFSQIPFAHIMLAECYLDMGLGQYAVQSAQQSTQLQPNNPELWYALGVAYSRLDNIERTPEINAFQRALQIKPDYADAWIRLAETYARLFRVEESAQAYEQGLALAPENADAWLALANTYTSLSQFAETADALSRVVHYKPHGVDAWVGLGVACGQIERWTDATLALLRATELSPKLAIAWVELGAAYLSLGSPQDALYAYRRYLALNPRKPDAYYNIGIAHDRLNQLDRALEAFEQAVKIEPFYADAWTNLGIVCGKLGRPEEEMEAYRKASELKPDSPDVWINLGASFDALAQYDEAIKAYEQALRIAPDAIAAWFNLGLVFAKQGDRERAEKIVQQLATLNQDLAHQLAQLTATGI